LSTIAARYVEVVRRRQPQGPYHLLGLCFGGIVAYEVARRLEGAGQRVESVVIVDAVLPHALPVDAVERLRSFAGLLPRALRGTAALRRRLRRRGQHVLSRVRRLQRPGARAERAPGELPIDGPEVEAEVRRFCATQGRRLRARLVVVRATGEASPAWRIVDPAH